MISKKTKIIYERDKYKYLIQPAHKRGDLLDAVKTILEFNQTIVNEDNNKILSEYNNINDDDNDNDNENDDDDDNYEVKQINNCFKKIDEAKPFEEQINLLKKWIQVIIGI